MAIPLSNFVRTDENIVKQPKVALVNSTDTLPPTTRPLAVTPVYPPPNNVGEIGNYPYSVGDPTPVGDENFNDSTPTQYAVEYLVFVTDEGSGYNVSSEETFETIDGWVLVPGSATNGVSLTTRDPQQGTKSLRFSKVSGGFSAGVQKAVTKDFSSYAGLSYYFDIYLSSLASVADVEFVTYSGGGTSDFHQWVIPVGSLVVGWNTIQVFVNAPTSTGGTFDISAITMLRFSVVFNTAIDVLSDIELDDFKGTDILTGKIATGDCVVGWARNSAWQTRFSYRGDLNRWALLDVDLGIISNGPRLTLPSIYLNDWNNRPVDFGIAVNGTNLTVSSVANEVAFTSPPAGTVQFALAEQTFNFSTSDLASYSGKSVTYSEVEDGFSAVSSTGAALLERNITMTFQANPEISKKDLTLNLHLDDEILSNSLGSTKEIPLTFVPTTGTVSMRYDPVPQGTPNPLVEGVDFVVNTDIPSIKFTKAEVGEVILSDFGTNPQNPKDPDSGLKRYDRLPLNYTDIVPTTVLLTQTGVGALVEDQDYLVDLDSGVVLLTYGQVTENLALNFFIADTSFVSQNFNLYINSVPVDTFSLIPETGWLNIDRPLFAGDVVTVDYESENAGPITSQSVNKSDGVTPLPIAIGGEFSFTVQNPPVVVTKFTVASDSTSVSLPGDRTTDYNANALLLMDEDYYVISSVAYNAGADVTTLTILEPARRDYTNPTTYYTKSSVIWATEALPHANTPIGVSTFVLLAAASRQQYYYAGIYVKIAGHVYAVRSSTIINGGADLEVQLSSKLTGPVSSSDTVYLTTEVIPETGSYSLKSFHSPIKAVPNRYDSNGDIIDLSTRFPGLSGDTTRLIRNGVDLVKDLDYTVDDSGNIQLVRDPIDATDMSFVLVYIPSKASEIGDEILADYTHFFAAESGVALRATLSYVLPDSFYFRVVNDNAQAVIFQNVLREFIKQKTGQVSAGSKPSVPASPSNNDSGVTTPISNVGDLYDNDLVAQRIYEFMTVRIGYLESEKMELCGEVVGGWTGPLTSSDIDTNALGSGRCFPVDPDITFAVEDKASDELIIPSRPYRVPALFGMPVEDDFSRQVRDRDYPRIPIVTIPPFPPQGQRYKGANVEPSTFSVLGVFSLGASAGAPSTFVENWYPHFLDSTYVNPFTITSYVTFGVTTTVTSSALDVNQDTGSPLTATPVFPSASRDLDPTDYQGFDVSSFPMPSFRSVAPRDQNYVPPSYEGAAIGALQAIDDAIEASVLAGTPHRTISGNDTSYPTGLGFSYRDSNEYDLLYAGTVPADTEYELINVEWQSGVRPVNLATYTACIKQQLVVLYVQRESVARQMANLSYLIAQISPTPTGDPELTTVTEASAALVAATSVLSDINAGIVNTQAFYNTSIIGGLWSDAALIARWLYLTGVDATGALTSSPLPIIPVVTTGRIDQIRARISQILSRLTEINTTLGFDNTATPTGFDSLPGSENLYSTRYTMLDFRLNRESGTLFKARSAHQQYIRNVNEAASLKSILSTFGG